jgi:hypothetical protein
MRHLSLALAIAAAILPVTMKAQTAPSAPSVPTTKILAIGSLTAPISSDEMKTTMPNEVRATVELYFEGKIDQWWSRQDGKGVVFLLTSHHRRGGLNAGKTSIGCCKENDISTAATRPPESASHSSPGTISQAEPGRSNWQFGDKQATIGEHLMSDASGGLSGTSCRGRTIRFDLVGFFEEMNAFRMSVSSEARGDLCLGLDLLR